MVGKTVDRVISAIAGGLLGIVAANMHNYTASNPDIGLRMYSSDRPAVKVLISSEAYRTNMPPLIIVGRVIECAGPRVLGSSDDPSKSSVSYSIRSLDGRVVYELTELDPQKSGILNYGDYTVLLLDSSRPVVRFTVPKTNKVLSFPVTINQM